MINLVLISKVSLPSVMLPAILPKTAFEVFSLGANIHLHKYTSFQ